jgi:acetyl esterase/lipase
MIAAVMKTCSPVHTHAHTSTQILWLCLSSFALLLSSAFCFADNACPSDIRAHLPPNEETPDYIYQPPPPNDFNILHRYRFVPPAPFNSPYPTVLILPPDVFYLEYGDRGVPSEQVATYDLQQAGFLVFQVDHRLAPPNTLPGQATDGRPPFQTDDIKRQILAALADPQCNQSIYLVGGSAGGCLALWCGLDSASTVPGWDNIARLKIKAVVSLSGISNLDDWNNPGGISMQDLMRFENNLDNYVGLPDQDHTHSTLLAASPVSLVSTASSSPAVMLYATIKDSVPYAQADDMYIALTNKFGTPPGKFIEYVLPDTTGLHAFHYWHTQNILVTPSDCVSHQVITFLQANP